MIELKDLHVAGCALVAGVCLVGALASGCGSSAVATGEVFESQSTVGGESSRGSAEGGSAKAALAGEAGTVSVKAGSVKAGSVKAGSVKAGSVKAVSVKAVSVKAASVKTVSVKTVSVKTAAAEGAGGVKVSGRVVYRGTPPTRRAINMTKDAKCGELHGGKPVMDEELIVRADGGVKFAFVRVQRGAPKKDYPMPDKPAQLLQEGCMFRPRVQGIRVGQKLLVDNGDPVTHNVRSFPVLNPAFNFGQPPKSGARERVFERAEREIEIQCDFHPWMHAYVFVMDHPFYSVSADDGSYTIEGLPPGEYTLETWHEKLGKQKQTVKVSDGDVTGVDFTYSR